MATDADPAAPLVDAIAEAVVDRLREEALPRAEVSPADLEPEEELRSRIWRMAPETRLPLADVAEVLGVSERTVRRYGSGEAKVPTLPLRKGPAGLVTTAADLRSWIEDAERAERFRESA